MRLSLVFEFLLIFVLVAFAASRVIDPKEESYGRALRKQHHHHHVAHKNRQQDSPNKYCSCSAKLCNCCRDFNIPVMALQGPGCASLQYLRGDRLAISMSFGDRVLTNTTIDGKKPKPVCMPLPGGVSKFCGRVYNIGRQGEDFNACLGLELRAVQDVEAALRVSCFRFGPKGLKVEPPQPLPVVQAENTEDDEDDDDDDDDDDEFDFDDVDDIEDDDDDEDEEETEDDDADNDVDSVDYGTFSVFDDDFIDSFFVPSESGTKKKKASTTTTVKPPVKKITRKPLRTVTKKTVASTTPIPTTKKAAVVTSTVKPIKKQKLKKTKKPQKTTTPIATSTTTQATTTAAIMQLITSATIVSSENVSDVKLSEGVVVPSTPHESIAAVTAMLQNIPGEGMPQADLKPTASAPEPTVMPASDPMPTEKQSEFTTTEQAVTQETMKEEVTEASETTTSMATTQMDFEEDEDEEEDEEVAASENYIIKNDETVESDEDSDPITDVVGDVISDEIDDDDDDEEETKSTTPVSKVEKEEKKKTEKKDVFTDIIDGVVDTFTGAESDEGTKNESADDDDDDDDEEDDDDDDVDFETRKAKQHQSKRNGGKFRQSRDMWLGRLHW
ncbi:PREDICTED: transcription initiation factor TFIID subunit 11 [Nicrophorus vespilloides]|uniref:Transcription initiation factor TFIID subunit 11 n=1 Tax=Nicrophorus vespilloides TaxID=110193 RepID=A0ABM1MJL9_NICVS|nr:PREDICTED: transcription initiation factor TFIID subunit 11 [Nicrophorus vespilloides]